MSGLEQHCRTCTPAVLFLLIVLLPGAQLISARAASSWRVFRAGDGLGQTACAAVSVNSQGKVFVRHSAAGLAGELDGYNVSSFGAPRGSLGRIAASPSGQVWALSASGLHERRGETWVLIPIPEIAAALRGGGAAHPGGLPFLPIRQGRVLVLLPDRLIEVNAERPDNPEVLTLKTAEESGMRAFLGINAASDGGAWVSGDRGVVRIAGPIRPGMTETAFRPHLAPAGASVTNFSEPFASGPDGVTTVAEWVTTGERIIAHFDGMEWQFHRPAISNVIRAWHGHDRRLWAMNADTLIASDTTRIETGALDSVPIHQFNDVAVEPSGSFWVATSDGLFRYSPACWRSPEFDVSIEGPVLALREAEGVLWFATATHLFALNESGMRQMELPAPIERAEYDATALYLLREGRLLLVAGDAATLFANGRWTPVDLTRRRVLGALRDQKICVWRDAAEGSENLLETFDGVAFEPWLPVNEPVAQAGRPLNVYQSRTGTAWLGCDSGVARYTERKWETFMSEDRTTPESGWAFVELNDDRIWCATQDRIWEFDGRNWIVVRPGFDRIHDMMRGRDGSVWVASNSGLWRWWQNAWIENRSEDGLGASPVFDVQETVDGRVWAATAEQLSLYYPAADPDPPRTGIQKLTGEQTIPEGGTLNLLFNGRDKWKFTAAARLLYSYRLDQHDWSPFQELNAVSFPDLAAGKHYFQVRAMDRNGNIEASPAQLEFAVALPWYRETRLVFAMALGIGAALFFAALAWNRHRRLVRSYAEVERQVAERTAQLERASRELMHSQKMNALGTLAAGVAHDFNNILSIVKGSAQIIEDNLNNPDKVRIRVDRIKTVVDQGSGIVKAMLGFSRDSDSQERLCDPNAVVEDTIRLLGDRFLRQTDVRFEPGPDLPQVIASRNFIQQVLLNLIFNAAEAAVDDTRVIVSTGKTSSLPGGLVLTPDPAPEYVTFSVRDFGCGISPENMSRIFEPFFTTKSMSARRGTGLGLSMVYELVKRMGGGLALETEVGKGSKFTLVLAVRDLKKSAVVS